ncbi:MAG: ribbon-helix-helix protein, CopG family [Gemmatimonadales bacterium]|nr:ribbon-helix-helix protein, CopG family [Gemmatimonadales bacterium]MYG48557.1 ribbon-helix-helix protein, CopG family [Gemmatimonadales bacterium]MYK03078.1 ribbon-helix-helix protein, CopG family [Candidatus Palauibacter ramosifaciens]
MDRIKTTVYLRATDYGKLKSIAAAENRSAAELIREAVGEYATRKVRDRLPRSIGMGDSGMPDLAERYEEYLDGFGEDEPAGGAPEAPEAEEEPGPRDANRR